MIKVILLSLVFSSNLCWSADRSLESVFKSSDLKSYDVAVLVESDQGKILFEKNSDRALIPASVTKILTAYSALKNLRASSTYTTKILISSQALGKGQSLKSPDTVREPLYIQGDGDPTMVQEQLHYFAERIAAQGVKELAGPIYLDSGQYGENFVPTGRLLQPTEPDRAYNAVLSSHNLNYNALTLKIRPGQKVGESANVTLEPFAYATLKNSARTVSQVKHPVRVERVTSPQGHDTIVVGGDVSINAGEMTEYMAATQPHQYWFKTWTTYLNQLGVKVKTQTVQMKTAPSNAVEWISHDSLPMRDLIILMNKYSNNLMADSVAYRLGQTSTSAKSGSLYDRGIEVMKNDLLALGLSLESQVIKTASGLSELNRLSPQFLNGFLKKIESKNQTYPEWLVSLPIMGLESHKSILNELNFEHGIILRAKTGSMDGVSAISGVGFKESGEKLYFSAIVNHPKRIGKIPSWQPDFLVAISNLLKGTGK